MPHNAKVNLRPRDLGRLEFGTFPPADPLGLTGFSEKALAWVPNRRVVRDIPKGFRLPIRLVTRRDGLRQIVNGELLSNFLVNAAAGGFAILSRTERYSKEQKQTYRLMQMLYRWSEEDRRMLVRAISSREDLELSGREARELDGARDVLPEIRIQDGDQSHRWTVDDLLDAGLREALAAGKKNPPINRQLELGLLAAAKRSPDTASLTAEQSGALLRLSLFGLNQGNTPRDSHLSEAVEERFIASVVKHTELDFAAFSKWMYEDFDNLVQLLSRPRKGLSVSRQEVRYILYDLLWKSFSYVSECVEMQLQIVRRVLIPKLRRSERRLFDLWYLRQPWLGGIVPLTLTKRLGFLPSTLNELAYAAPEDDGPWRTMLKALSWNQELITNRRAADAARKRTSRDRLPRGMFSDVYYDPDPFETDEFDDE
jgi:hypothetical protein